MLNLIAILAAANLGYMIGYTLGHTKPRPPKGP